MPVKSGLHQMALSAPKGVFTGEQSFTNDGFENVFVEIGVFIVVTAVTHQYMFNIIWMIDQVSWFRCGPILNNIAIIFCKLQEKAMRSAYQLPGTAAKFGDRALWYI